MTAPEEKARERIDYQLNEAGWIIQNRDEINLAANDGVIIREFPLFGGEGFADYMIFVGFINASCCAIMSVATGRGREQCALTSSPS